MARTAAPHHSSEPLSSTGLPALAPAAPPAVPIPNFQRYDAAGSYPDRAYMLTLGQYARSPDWRQARRRSLHCPMTLLQTDGPTDAPPARVSGQLQDISEGGLYGVVPVGSGIAIGQQFTFQFSLCEAGPEPGTHGLVTQVGEIIRTELLVDAQGHADRIGIGVRLIGPRSGMVPMPENLM